MTDSPALPRAFAPLFIDVQTMPERDTSLSTLAAEYGCSPSHFHKLFKEATGETPKAFVDRIRLERAVYRLAVTQDSILDIALSVGFQSHETFSRAFRRRFGKTPLAVRREGRSAGAAGTAARAMVRPGDWSVSDAGFLTLKPMALLAWRRIGPYGAFGAPRFDGAPSDWSPLLDPLSREGIAHQSLGLVISYDNPFLTPPHLQQLDACVPSLDPGRTPLDPEVRAIRFDGGLFGVVEHRGPPDTLVRGYRALVEAIGRAGTYRLRDGPPLEILRTPGGTEAGDGVTEIYLPVERSR